MGGLGNQMFQYAAATAIALRHQKKLFFDLQFLLDNQEETDVFTPRSFSLDIFNVKGRVLNSSLKRIFDNAFLRAVIPGRLKKVCHSYNDQSDFSNIEFPACMEGYFQSEDYFKDYRSILLDDFSFKLPLGNHNEKILMDIENSPAVSVHVRRGDYVSKIAVASVHSNCDIEYYERAITWMREKIGSPVFYFFTDDPLWVKQNFIDKYSFNKMVLIDKNDGADSWKDMLLMSRCKHHIIANSSFSWWGAWLNCYPQKMVIAPRQWFSDKNKYRFAKEIIPESWIRL